MSNFSLPEELYYISTYIVRCIISQDSLEVSFTLLQRNQSYYTYMYMLCIGFYQKLSAKNVLKEEEKGCRGFKSFIYNFTQLNVLYRYISQLHSFLSQSRHMARLIKWCRFTQRYLILKSFLSEHQTLPSIVLSMYRSETGWGRLIMEHRK